MDITKVDDIPYSQFMSWWECITILEAQEMLISLKAEDWPYQKEKDREKALNKLNKAAYPDNFREKKELTHDGLARALSRS